MRPPIMTRDMWKSVRAHYIWRCYYCGRPTRSPEKRVLADASDGSHDALSVVPMCTSCGERTDGGTEADLLRILGRTEAWGDERRRELESLWARAVGAARRVARSGHPETLGELSHCQRWIVHDAVRAQRLPVETHTQWGQSPSRGVIIRECEGPRASGPGPAGPGGRRP